MCDFGRAHRLRHDTHVNACSHHPSEALVCELLAPRQTLGGRFSTIAALAPPTVVAHRKRGSSLLAYFPECCGAMAHDGAAEGGTPGDGRSRGSGGDHSRAPVHGSRPPPGEHLRGHAPQESDLLSLSAALSAIADEDGAEEGDAPKDGVPGVGECLEQESTELDDMEHVQGCAVSIFSRRGRPNKHAQEAMHRLMGRAPPRTPGSASSSAVVPRGRGAPTGGCPDVGTTELSRSKRQELVKQAGVRVASDGSILKRPIGGIAPLPMVAGATFAASRLAANPGERLDAEILHSGPQLLGASPVAVGSKRLRAASIGVSEDKLGTIETLLASAALMLDRHGRAQLEKALARAAGHGNLLMYIDAVAYDETPLPVALRQARLQKPAPMLQPMPPGCSQAGPLIASSSAEPISLLSERHSNTRGLQKVLSIAQSGGLLLKLGEDMFSIISLSVSPLAILEKGTATVLKEATLRLSGVTLASTWSDQCTRAVCTDRASANLLAERLVGNERGAKWQTLHIHCEAHKVATCHEVTFGLIDDHIKGMIHCALSLRDGSSMDTFRACMRAEVSSRIVVRRGAPPAEAVQYKKAVLRLFVSHGAQLPMRRILLALCPNGDWRKEAVECYLPVGKEYSHDNLVKFVSDGVVSALCASQPVLYKRARWTGADLSTDCLGILEACHGLLSSTYMRFAASFQHASRARKVLLSQPEGLGGAREQSIRHSAAGVAPDAAAAELPVAVLSAAGDMDATAGQEADPRAAELNWPEINASHRRQGATWVAGKPLGLLMLQRLVMEPLRQLLVRLFEVAGDQWEQTQRCKLAEKLKSSSIKFTDREYRLCIAGQGVDELLFSEQLRALLTNDGFWRHLPFDCHTVEFQALALRLISRAGCAVFELLEAPHRLFPFQLFRLLAEPGLVDTLLAVPDCMLDSWSRDMKSMYPSFSGSDFMQKLALTSQLCWKDISQLESRHATIRRLLLSASLQTHVQAFQDLGSQWLCLQLRKRMQRLSGATAARAKPGTKALSCTSCLGMGGRTTLGAPLIKELAA